MGVPGLWDILNKAGQSVSIAQLAIIRGFEQNTSGRRAYRIGIDVSIWFHHAAFSKGGENAELRNLFFRLLFLARLPILPLFIFDGRQRPKMKRGSRLGKSGSHELSREFKKFLDAFGMEWREAAAEAEAELAYLNRNGFIDAIMTDDCDAFLFGACTILKNFSKQLSGNKNNPALNQNQKSDKLHTMLYSVTDLKDHPDIRLTRGGMILFALLAGGDYHPGVPNFGKVVAHAIARCDFGDELLEGCQNLQGQDLAEFLMHWRGRVNQELSTNSRGFLRHRTSLSIPKDFPDMEVLKKYANPTCSNANNSVALRDRGQLDLGRVGQLCEEYFEWGYKSRILERFRTLMWPCAVMHVLRRTALEIDRKKALSGSVVVAKDIGTSVAFVQMFLSRKKEDRTERYADAFICRGPAAETAGTACEIPDPHPLILGIAEKNRRHASTDGVLEYRVKISPIQLVDLVTKALKGKRTAPGDATEKTDDPNEAVNLWFPAAMIDHVYPDLVEQNLTKEQEKGAKKGKTKTKKGKEKAMDLSDSDVPFPCPSSSPTSRIPYSSTNTDCDTNFDHTPLRAIPDPWFYSDSTTPSPSKGPAKRGFLFTFRDPSFDEFPEEEDTKQQEKAGPSSLSTRFDECVDQTLYDPLTKRKYRKREREEVMDPKIVGIGRPRKKRRKIDGSANLLDVLDSLKF